MTEALDPRGIEIPALLARGLTLDDVALPCGRLACEPFSAECLQDPEQPAALAVRAAAFDMATRVLGETCEAQSVTIQEQQATIEQQELEQAFLRSLVEKLSIDQKLGIMTVNSLKVLYELLESTGFLEKLAAAGYIMDLMFLDADWLKSHNSLGNHDGGDVALAKLVTCLRPLYRRKTDFIGILDYKAEIEEAVEDGKLSSVVSRYDRGDEVVVVSFVPPPRGRSDQRDPVGSSGLVRRRREIIKNLQGVEVSYRLAPGRSLKALRAELDSAGSGLEYRVRGRTVHASVSAGFAIVRARIPRDLVEFEKLAAAADAAMAPIKADRRGSQSRGVVVNFLAA